MYCLKSQNVSEYEEMNDHARHTCREWQKFFASIERSIGEINRLARNRKEWKN